ncbi:MAG: maleylpyruvate isomerase family mycothiol-dependent enzyme [Candidatus Tectomicrobia bacterium]|nr:maleylpyruvate isomerase family mycothiol-dependent enzyme [Candidatus Tectomicrobia bacterium]
MTIWEMTADQRRQLADLLDDLDEAQWNTPSLCTEWTVREVVGHLVTPFALGTAKMLLRIALNGFNFNKMISKTAKEFAQRPTSELVSTLRANAESQWTPPGLGPEAPLGDVVMHTQDICRPLGIEPMVDADKARIILDMLVSRKGKAFTNSAWIAGLRLAPNDLDWSWGDGPEISGTAEAIIMSLGGRTAAFADLSGAGADEFRDRVARK